MDRPQFRLLNISTVIHRIQPFVIIPHRSDFEGIPDEILPVGSFLLGNISDTSGNFFELQYGLSSCSRSASQLMRQNAIQRRNLARLNLSLWQQRNQVNIPCRVLSRKSWLESVFETKVDNVFLLGTFCFPVSTNSNHDVTVDGDGSRSE